jgi:phospholipid-translocating ATPase
MVCLAQSQSAALPGLGIDDDVDPDLQLRITRTATESIHESIREDERRRVGKTRRRKARSFFGASLRKSQHHPARHDAHAEEPSGGVFRGEEQRAKAEEFATPEPKNEAESRRRRNVWVNIELPMSELDRRGQPAARYARNKVRTSKYSLLSFLPKVSPCHLVSFCRFNECDVACPFAFYQNLAEQFRRVANIYFLCLVILQGMSAAFRGRPWNCRLTQSRSAQCSPSSVLQPLK